MFNYHVDFNSPWYLLLLLLAPALWIVSYRSLAGLGNIRRLIAISLRTLVLLLLVFALATPFVLGYVSALRAAEDRRYEEWGCLEISD